MRYARPIMKRIYRGLPGVLLALLLACAHTPKTFTEYPATQPVALSSQQEGPEVEALVNAFYGPGADPAQLRPQLESVLARYPRSSRAHEVAGYLAILNADAADAVDHFIVAASDLDSPLAPLYLWELARWTTSSREDSRVLELVEALSQRHPNADVRDQARFLLVQLQQLRLDLPGAQATAAELGFLREWNLIGPFDNDQGKGFFTAYPPESELSLQAKYPGKLLPVHWRKVRPDDTGTVALDDLLAPRDFAVGYLATFVGSDSATAAELRLDVGDAVEVWWNDALVVTEETLDDGIADSVVIPVQLQRGWNKVLIKSCVRRSSWSLSARLTRPGGGALNQLRQSADPQPYTRAAAAAQLAPTGFVPAPVLALSNVSRRDFLSSRFAAATGRRKLVLPPLERFAAAAPGNPLASHYLALGYWSNDELGKAIDLLNAGVQRFPTLAGFPLRRASYFRSKRLWERAQADLRQIQAATPAAAWPAARREVSLELARLYQARGFTLDQCRELEGLVAAVPDLAYAHVDYAQCLDDLGYTERAEAELHAALALEPANVTANQRLIGSLQRRLEHDEALRVNTTLRSVDPYSLGWQMQRANIQRRRGDHAGARAVYEAIAAQSPDWPASYERLADLAYEERREATGLYRQALERNPSSSELAERLAFLEPKRPGLADALVPSEEQIEAAVRGSDRIKALPGSYAVELLAHELVEIEKDGSARRTITEVTRAENEQGVDQLTRVDLAPGGKRKVLKAYALTPKGERQDASSIQDTVVRFRKLDPGSITVLQYVHYRPSGAFLPHHYADIHYFQSPRNHLARTEWVLVHDKSRTLEVDVRGPVKETRVEHGDQLVRTFSAEQVPPLLNEPFMPPVQDLLHKVSITTLNTWDEYWRWEKALLSEAFRSSPELEGWAARLTQGAQTPREKLDRLFHAVTTDIRYQQEYETTIAGVRPHTGPVTMERGYGDCKDKAVLLMQLGKLVGLQLEFALLRTTTHGKVERAIPRQQFNHAIVHVPAQPGIESSFFLDPTTDGLDMGNLRSDDQGALSLVTDLEGKGYRFELIPYQSPGLEYQRHHIRVQIKSPSEASAVDELSARGTSAAWWRGKLRTPEIANKAFEGLGAYLFTGATLKSRSSDAPEDLWRPLQLQLNLDVSSAIQNQGETWRLPLPAYLGDSRASSLATRVAPVHFGISSSEAYDVDAELPEGYRVVKAPSDFNVEHPCFSARRTSHIEGRQVQVRFTYTRRCPGISVADYAEFRKASLDVQRELRSELVFERDVPRPRGDGRARRPMADAR
ncbi:MAG: hypothetical protein RL685_717 [Pseudomonadota bacterium]